MRPDSSGWTEPPEPPEPYGPLIRPYALTRGRITADGPELDLLTLVVALRDRLTMVDAEPEHELLLRLCQEPVSVAEVAGHSRLPLAVVKVLLADLIAHRQLIFRSPAPAQASRDPQLLRAVLDGIRAL
jgi:hypothetical protein